MEQLCSLIIKHKLSFHLLFKLQNFPVTLYIHLQPLVLSIYLVLCLSQRLTITPSILNSIKQMALLL